MCSYTYSWYYCNHDYYIWCAPIPLSHPVDHMLIRAKGQFN